MQASLQAEKMIEAEQNRPMAQWRLQVKQARYQAERAERCYRSVEPENRLVARTLGAEWEERLDELTTAEDRLTRREHPRPPRRTDEQREGIHRLGVNLNRAWEAPATMDRDCKKLLRALLETVDLLRRLAAYYPDSTIACIFNRQGRKTEDGLGFTASRVGSLRHHWKIPRFRPPQNPPEGESVSIERTAQILGVVPSTVHRGLNEGFIAGEQTIPGTPWRNHMDEAIKPHFVESTPGGYVPIMIEATKILGVTRQIILQRVKRGELQALHGCQGRRKRLRTKIVDNQPSLFDSASSEGV
jgi:uncharacterized protein YndB with AHSA1/START domain